MKRLALLGVLLWSACAPVAVRVVRSDEFTGFSIPRRIMLAGSDNSADTQFVVKDLSARFDDAGFDVVSAEDVNSTLARVDADLSILLGRSDYRRIRELTGVGAVVLVRQFFGTELRFIDTATGSDRAFGCWRTTTITIANDVIEQLKGRKPGTGLCPIKRP